MQMQLVVLAHRWCVIGYPQLRQCWYHT
jgi:hypothetical protein